MRSQGDGKGIQLAPPMKRSLERALKSIAMDEYVGATPKNLRLRKEGLNEALRRRTGTFHSGHVRHRFQRTAGCSPPKEASLNQVRPAMKSVPFS